MGNVYHLAGQWIGAAWRERPRLVNNPIITRELITQLRKKQSFGYLFFFLTVASIVFIYGWNLFVQKRSVITNEEFGRTYMLLLSLIQGIVLCIITPMLSATAVNLEKERETWDLLLTSPIGVASILIGKLLSSFSFLGFVLISLTPVVSLSMVMGGVSPGELCLIVLAMSEAIALVALIGLYCSIRWKKSIQSITFTYVIGVIYFGIAPILLIYSNSNNQFDWMLLFSPSFLLLYILNPSNIGDHFGFTTFWQALCVHFSCMAIVMTFFLFLCVWQFMPRISERIGDRFKRLVIGFGVLAGQPWFLTAGVWGVASILLAVCVLAGNYYYLTDRSLYSLQFHSMQLLFLLFPLSSTVSFYLEWEKKPWDEVGSTPSKLERTFYRFLWRPLKVYGKWMLGVFPIYLCILIIFPGTIEQAIWSILFGAETVLYISLIAMACTLITRSAFVSIVYCYAISALYFFVIPATIGSAIRNSISPIDVALSPYTIPTASRPFSQMMDVVWMDSVWMGAVTLHIGLTVVFFIVVLLFCQKRLLGIAERFEREKFSTWLKRNLFDRKPKVSKVPPDVVIPYFPDARNPIAVREIREFFLHKRSQTVKTSIWLFLGSAAFFWLVPFSRGGESARLIRDALTFVMLISPLFIAPFAANSFRRERDQDTWDMLLTTTLSIKDFLYGKLLSGFVLFCLRYGIVLIPVVVLGFLSWMLGGKHYANTWNVFLMFIAIGSPFFLFISLFSTFLSARLQKTTSAYIASLLLPFLLIYSPIVLELMKFQIPMEHRTWLSAPCLFERYFDKGSVVWRNSASLIQISIFLGSSVLFYYFAYYQLKKEE